MIRKLLLFIQMLFVAFGARAQNEGDSTQNLNEVVVRSYFSERPLLSSPASVSILTAKQLQQHTPTSLVSSMNTVPGIRFEERSPGSYRLSIRGSLLRSPFGIRNVKVYYEDFPLTDAGGNTYVNLLDASGVNRIEVLKGPEGSIFGANTGGVINISSINSNTDSIGAGASLIGGSYGLFQQRASVSKTWGNDVLNISQANLKSEGYRENSALKRNVFNLSNAWNYSAKGSLRSLLLVSKINYQTPGGLTIEQSQENPRSARLKTKVLPGAVAQKAAIQNATVFTGIANEYKFSESVRHVISFFASHTDFANPFITNFEERKENSGGARTYIEVKNRRTGEVKVNWQTGLEAQVTRSNKSNFDNNAGTKGPLQKTPVQLRAYQTFLFTHISAGYKNWVAEAAGSLNYYKYKLGDVPLPAAELNERKLDAQLMPRVALSYALTPDLNWRTSAAKGYSPPTIEETYPSNNIVNNDLQPEKGWNYETGFRFHGIQDRLYLDAVVFDYRLKKAIVRRQNEAGAEYFVNAGGTKQRGFESQLFFWIVAPHSTGVIQGLQLQNAFTYSHFRFSDYVDNGNSYSNNRLTGVPQNVIVSGLVVNLPVGIYLFGQHNYTSSMPVNDANTIEAGAYNLIEARAGIRTSFKKTRLDFFAGGENLTNEKYSLGNDLNAAGSRYYNPAPQRNFYFGLNAEF